MLVSAVMRLWFLATLLLLCACSAGPPDDDDDDDDDSLVDYTLPQLDCSSSAGLYEGQATLTTAAEVEEFFANYNAISGNFSLRGSELSQAPGLGCLVQAEGEVLVENTQLPFVDLRSLVNIGESLSIHDNPDIRQIAAPNLEIISLFTVLNSNDRLEAIDLSSVHTLRLDPPSNEDSNLHALQSERNPALVSFNLDSLRQCGGILEFDEDDQLTEISLPALEQVSGAIQIDNLDALLLFDLPSLEQIGGELRFDHNGPLHSLFNVPPDQPLTVSAPMLSAVGDRFYVDNNPSAMTMDFSALTSVGGEFFLRGSVVLPQLDLGALQSVAGDFLVSEFYAIEDLTLNSLEQVDGAFSLTLSKQLATMSAPLLETIAGGLQITQHDALTNLSFPALESVQGDLEIRFNPVLPNTEVCEVWAQIGEGLQGDLISGVGCPL